MEQTVDTPFPQAVEGIVESEYVAAAPAAARRRRTGNCMAPALATACAAPATLKEYVASSPAPVIEHVASAPAATYTAPVIEYVPILTCHGLCRTCSSDRSHGFKTCRQLQ